MNTAHRRNSSIWAHWLSSVSMLWLAGTAQAPHACAAEPARVTLRSEGHERFYYLLMPPASADLPAPVMLLLHGSYSTPLDILPSWSQWAERAGVILAAPKSSAEYGWRLRQDGPLLMRDIIDDISRRHMIDRRRLYVFGFSAGAVHALTLGLLESQYFAAVALHAGAWTDGSSFQLTGLARRRIPVWISVGDYDEQFPLPSVRATETALRNAGLPVTVIVMKGHRHSYQDVAERVNPQAWAFLEAVQLEEAPVFDTYGSH